MRNESRLNANAAQRATFVAASSFTVRAVAYSRSKFACGFVFVPSVTLTRVATGANALPA